MNRKLSLEKLEKNIWRDGDFPTTLIRRCHELRKIPVGQLSVEDLRLLIGQQIGLTFLMEIAIEKLSENILSEGDFYPGDLLNSVLTIDPDYWRSYKSQWTTLNNLLKENVSKLQEIDLNTGKFYGVDFSSDN